MGIFKEWIDKANSHKFNQYFDNNGEDATVLKKIPGTEIINLINKVISFLQHHNQTIHNLLSHHNQILGAKVDRSSYKSGGTLNTIAGAEGSLANEMKQLESGYQTLDKLTRELSTSVQQKEGKRDIKLFALDLIKTIKEGENFSSYFKNRVSAEAFDDLKMNYMKLIRMVEEGRRVVDENKTQSHFSNTSSSVQQHRDAGSSQWRKRDNDSVQI